MAARRVDDLGRAFKGSQRHIQIYVNRRQTELDAAIRDQIPEIGKAGIRWVSPLEEKGFIELRDNAFLEALGLGRLRDALAGFWPRGGPVWDALATIALPRGNTGVLLIEGKSHANELRSSCKASEPARTTIAKRLNETRVWLDASGEIDPWLMRYYQLANRLAHLRFLNEQGVDAWLGLASFTDDRDHRPTSREELERSIDDASRALGVDLLSQPKIIHVVLPSCPAWTPDG